MIQRRCLVLAAPMLLGAVPALHAQQPAALPSVAVLDLDFVDDHPRPDTGGAQAKRLAAAHAQLQQALGDAKLYRVIDVAPALPLLSSLRDQQEFMYRCEGCAQQVGRKLATDLVMVAWVQKVSELILNFNVELRDVATGQPILAKSVDMRGNNDESWRRAVAYLVRDMAEKRAKNPRYGLPTPPAK